MREDLLLKLKRFTIKKRELETLLTGLGFTLHPGKGSHIKWIKRGLPPLVIASHDKEVKTYILKQVIKVLKMGDLI